MILLDKVQALIKFLNGKPVQTLSRGLDYTKEFTLRQITYAYTVIVSLVSLSMLGLIVPSTPSNWPETFSIVNENAKQLNSGNSGQNRPLSPLTSKFKLVSITPRKVVGIVPHLVPAPKKIRSYWFPLTFVWTYKLSRPSELNFFFVLKPVNTHLQVPILTDKKVNDKFLSAGMYLEGIKMVSPAFPLIKNEIFQAKSSLLNYLGYFTRNINQFLDDNPVNDIYAEESPDIATRQLESTSSPANMAETVDPALNDSSIHLVRANSLYPHRGNQQNGLEVLQNTNTSQRLGGSFKSFKNHALRSLYFRVDLLRTFVLRIEP